jgi:hypothetical protein
MASNHDRHFLDLMTKQCRLFELALEECIAQFDYNNNKEWQANFKENMLKHAKDKMRHEEESH